MLESWSNLTFIVHHRRFRANIVLSFTLARRHNLQHFSRQCESGFRCKMLHMEIEIRILTSFTIGSCIFLKIFLPTYCLGNHTSWLTFLLYGGRLVSILKSSRVIFIFFSNFFHVIVQMRLWKILCCTTAVQFRKGLLSQPPFAVYMWRLNHIRIFLIYYNILKFGWKRFILKCF